MAVIVLFFVGTDRTSLLKGSLQSTAAGRILAVPGDFPTIQEAIDAAEGGDTVRVAEGSYTEMLSITKDRISLEGAGPDNTILKGNSANPVVLVSNARDVRIVSLAIREGAYGVQTEFASLTCSKIRLQDNAYGLAVRFNSYAKIADSNVAGNKTDGVLVLANSSASMTRCQLTRNGGNGLRVMQTSSAILTSSALTDNGGNGVQAAEGSSLTATGNEIVRNKYSGVDVTGHSVGALWGGNHIAENADFSDWRSGVGVHHNSEVTIGFSPNKDVIENNNGPGLFVANSSSLFLKSGIVSDNHGDGVHLAFDSAAHLEEGAVVIRNHGYGIATGDLNHDSKYWNQGGDLGSEGPPDTLNESGPTNAWSF
jgi:hypothetical protein